MATSTHKKHINKQPEIIITTDGKEGFFSRGKEIAKLADRGETIPSLHIVNFESVEEMLAVLTKARRGLMALLREADASIPEIVRLLNRDRSAVVKDIKLLEQYGLVTIRKEVNPGHGYRKVIHSVSKRPIKLQTII
jgi:predicted transcriptional regulator